MRFMKSYETSLDHNHILDYWELLHLLLQFKGENKIGKNKKSYRKSFVSII